VFGGLTPQCSKVTREVLEIVCDKLHQASAIKIAEITKVVENAYRFIEISLANQLSLGFPDINMVEVLNLAATKWNMGHFHPSLGPGGHCVPVAPRHLLMAATTPSELSLIERAVSGRLRVADDVLKDVLAIQPQSVLVLGLSYRADVKMAVLSASIPLAQGFADSGVGVICFDPYFSAHEVRALVKGSIAGSQDDLGRPQVVVLCTDHAEFLSSEFIQSIVDINPMLVVDNTGRWESVAWSNTTHYARVGTGALRRVVQDELSKYEELSVAV
jgi:nucleotide sugar dehydrogenase